MHLTYVALHKVTSCMLAWCTLNAPRWQQFHVAPAMSVRSVHHFGGYSETLYKKLFTDVDLHASAKLFTDVDLHASAVSLLESG